MRGWCRRRSTSSATPSCRAKRSIPCGVIVPRRRNGEALPPPCCHAERSEASPSEAHCHAERSEASPSKAHCTGDSSQARNVGCCVGCSATKHFLRRAVMQSAAKHPPLRRTAQGIPRQARNDRLPGAGTKHPPLRRTVMQSAAKHPLLRRAGQGIPRQAWNDRCCVGCRTAKHFLRHAVMQSAAKHPPGRNRAGATALSAASHRHDLVWGIPHCVRNDSS